MDDLAGCLRAWRDRLGPAAVGLPTQHNRRAPGLRREELAQLAGVSVDYLSRLEQGRATNPSPQVLGALARALRLDDAERDHLYRVGGQQPPGRGWVSQHITPGVQRILDRLEDVPVLVVDAAWTTVAWNPLAAALLGDPGVHEGRERNVLWRHFNGHAGRVRRTPRKDAEFEAAAVADLHAAVGRYPEDTRLRALVADLSAASPRFAELWDSRPAAVYVAARKTIVHPDLGELTLDCDELRVPGSDLRIIVYTAEPGSRDADALALLGVVGLQTV